MRVALNSDITLHVQEHGEGSPDVILLHGWAVSSEVWRPVISRWPATGAGRLLAVDQRGTGWSSKPSTYTLDDYVSDIVGLIDQLKLENAVLVGHSLGGVIAQRVALERPDALSRLVLVCPVPASGVPLSDEQIGFFRSLGGHRDGAHQVITMTMAAEAPPEDLDRLVLAASSVSTGAFQDGFDAWRTADFGDRLPEVSTPTVVIAGGADQILPAALLQETIVDHIPGASLVSLEGSGHYPQLEAADAFTQALREQVDAARS